MAGIPNDVFSEDEICLTCSKKTLLLLKSKLLEPLQSFSRR